MNPLSKFKAWFRLAKKEYPFDHTAFNLSTSINNKPYSRMVLLKKILPNGFIFFTNLNSNKGKQFKSNPNLSMCFYWDNLKKQIRIVGKGEICPEKESDEYFSSRLRGSQIGAWASKQSSQIKDRAFLIKKYKDYERKFKDIPISRPAYWVGIKITPYAYEFWEEGDFRLHKREYFYLTKNNWRKKILSP